MTATADARPTILIAEDDAASGEFFRMALAHSVMHITLHANGIAALEDATRRHFDLLILDRHLPAAGGEDILLRLRADPRAASRETPALATSAEVDSAVRRRLLGLGFTDVLVKPLAVARLREGVREALSTYAGAPPLLDDAAAIAQSGTVHSVAALRDLFGGELQRLADDLAGSAPPPVAELADRLHRLMASCGFCGARALGARARALKQRLDEGFAASTDDLCSLRTMTLDTLRALHESRREPD